MPLTRANGGWGRTRCHLFDYKVVKEGLAGKKCLRTHALLLGVIYGRETSQQRTGLSWNLSKVLSVIPGTLRAMGPSKPQASAWRQQVALLSAFDVAKTTHRALSLTERAVQEQFAARQVQWHVRALWNKPGLHVPASGQ